MQEKKQNISPIKQRILQFIDYANISKREFYRITEISRGTLESKTSITEDIMARFIAIYPQVNPIWLLIGEGPMLRRAESTEPVHGQASDHSAERPPGPCQQCALREQIIASKTTTIEALQALNAELVERLATHEGQKRKAG